MHRFAYRNFGTIANPINSYVGNFAVNVSGREVPDLRRKLIKQVFAGLKFAERTTHFQFLTRELIIWIGATALTA
ncbi:MAG: hypothetical protein WKF71_06225 [Pyrinomonadaceae bacterium]